MIASDQISQSVNPRQADLPKCISSNSHGSHIWTSGLVAPPIDQEMSGVVKSAIALVSESIGAEG